MKEDWKTWLIGALFTLTMLFGGVYLSGLDARQLALQQVTYSHAERITTLEESKRNTESLLEQIRVDIQDIKRALIDQNRPKE